MPRLYRYVGPPEIAEAEKGRPPGTLILNLRDLSSWQQNPENQEGWATYIIDHQYRLRLAARRSEHVACAEGAPVLAAGEILFEGFEALEVSNQSTGYCPDIDCWKVVERVLGELGLNYPESWTFAAIFRNCPQCAQNNLVKDEWFYCLVCDSALPEHWNYQD